MKQTLIILILNLTTNSLFACLSASQNRLFPLGQTTKGLCVVETHLYRTEFREDKKGSEIKTGWGGFSYFKIYDKNYKEIYSATLDTIRLFEEHHYDSIVGKTLNKGLALAKTYPDFVTAKPLSISFCDYQQTCAKARLLFDTINNKIKIQLPNKIKYDVKVLFDSTSIASNVLDYYGGFDDADISAKGFNGNIYINSVRQFLIGNKKLIIAHIGSGQTFEHTDGGTYPPGKEYKAKFPFTDISKSVFEEPVLHHGHGFDFFIWE